MKYLLDTNVIVDHLRGKRSIKSVIIKQSSAVSIITLAELFYGAYKSAKAQENLAKINQMTSDLLIQTVPLDKKIADSYAKLKASLEKKGKKLDDFDLLVAATALNLDLILVSWNTKHFERISQLKLLKPNS